MKKRNEEYVPQFDLDNVEKKEIQPQKCTKCGKFSVSVHNGYCFECRRQEEESQRKATEEHLKKQNKNKSVLYVTIFLAVFIVIFLISFLILADIIPASETLKRACYKGLVGAILSGITSAIYLPISKLMNSKNKMDDEEM